MHLVPDLSAAQRQLDAALGRPISVWTTHGAHVSVTRVPASPELRVPASDAWIYTPPGYQVHRQARYPVVYLVHGHPGTAADWFTFGRAERVLDELIRSRTIAPVVAVAPDVNGGRIRDGECLDDISGGPMIETWLYQRLLPFVDENWRTQADPGRRMIVGMSAGGFCALDQGLRHPGIWGGIGALEGYGDPGRRAARSMGYDDAGFAAHSPSSYLPTMTFDRRTPVFLGAGARSGRARAEPLAEALRAAGQPVMMRVEPGMGHTWAFARTSLSHALAYLARELGWMHPRAGAR